MDQDQNMTGVPSEWRRPDFGRTPQEQGGWFTTEGGAASCPAPPPGMGGSGGEHPAQLQMESGLDLDALDGPFTNAELAKTSLKGLLMRNLGFYVVAGFLVGTQDAVSWEGILYSVGNDYIVLYQPDVDRYITGDLYSLKFVEFHNTRGMTPWAGYRRRDSLGAW